MDKAKLYKFFKVFGREIYTKDPQTLPKELDWQEDPYKPKRGRPKKQGNTGGNNSPIAVTRAN